MSGRAMDLPTTVYDAGSRSFALGSTLTSKRLSPTSWPKRMPAPPDFSRTSPSTVSKSVGRRVRAGRHHCDQRLARRGGGLPDLDAAAHDAAAAASGPLVGCQRGVAFDHDNAVHADAEFLRCHLRDGDAQSLAQVDLAREDRHGAVGIDRNEPVDRVRVERLADRGVGTRLALRKCGRGKGKADDQRAAGLQEFAAGQGGGVIDA